MFLNLQKDAKIILPNALDIKGKSHQLTSVNSLKAKRCKGLYIIQNDLNRISNSIQRYIKNPSHDFEYFSSLIITYRKCFADNKGRHAKLEMQRDLKRASQKQFDFHRMLIELGNRYIAHADNTQYEQSLVKLVLDDHKKAIGVQVFLMNFEIFEITDYSLWLQLLDLLKKNIITALKKLYDSIINEYNTSL